MENYVNEIKGYAEKMLRHVRENFLRAAGAVKTAGRIAASAVRGFLQSLWGRAKRLLVCFDQFLNVLLLNGREDETLSSRFYRWGRKGGFWRGLPEKIADTLFFFDYEKENGRKIGHCEKSYRNEVKRTGFPLEMQ